MSNLREPSERVSPRARLMWTLGAGLQAVMLCVALVLTSYIWHWYDMRWWIACVAGLVIAVNVVVVPPWRYRVHRWEVTDTAVYTQTGWWTRERRIAPMSRIQTVDYAEGAIARLFGLASVTVTTASAAGALQIEGLDRLRARQLTDELTVSAASVEGDAT